MIRDWESHGGMGSEFGRKGGGEDSIGSEEVSVKGGKKII